MLWGKVTININFDEKIFALYNQLTFQASMLYALCTAQTWSQKAGWHIQTLFPF